MVALGLEPRRAIARYLPKIVRMPISPGDRQQTSYPVQSAQALAQGKRGNFLIDKVVGHVLELNVRGQIANP
jgi:hypothetical protein